MIVLIRCPTKAPGRESGCCNGIIYLVDVLTAQVKRLMIGHHGQDGCICDCDEDGDLSTYINPKCLVSWHPAR